MKTKILFILIMLFSGIRMTAQTTGLFTYDGGYFIKDGNNWSEYRPGDKDGVWATYKQTSEETNYYHIENSECRLSIPKTNDITHIWILEENEWKTLYSMKHIYNSFEDESREIYTYNEGGYFVRDGNHWREYRSNNKSGVWAYYTQYKEDDNFFYMQSTVSSVCVPKAENSSFYLLDNGKWIKCYTCSAIYTSYIKYDYIFDFDNYGIFNKNDTDNKNGQTYASPSNIYISRQGYAMAVYGNERHNIMVKQSLVKTINGVSYIFLFPEVDNIEKYIIISPTWGSIYTEGIYVTVMANETVNGKYQQQFDEIIKMIDEGSFFTH